ncbi:hypothetical protein DMA11_20680 [Marinilabiliaceae bacterium JC017]|nr:hypothetical protein DMA11_20680 [Marinilabiliaceae bacterium JC017]
MDSFARKKVSSSTLVEVIVAMLIASIVFSFTFSILLNVTGNAPMVSKSCACLVGNSFLEQMKCKPEVSLNGQVDKWQGWFIHKSIKEYKGLVGLRMMEVKVIDANGTEKAVCRCLSRSYEN